MYNSWAQVENIEYAESYTIKVMDGFTVQSDGVIFPVKIPGDKLVLGYPASPRGAASGFIDPTDVVSMVLRLRGQGRDIAGLMTWSIGWDFQSGWLFANVVDSR